jgi:hypothetical protein
VTPDEYIDSLDEPRQSDVRAVDELIGRVAPQLDRQFWRGMIVYGLYHYRHPGGVEGDWYPIALSGQKRFSALYVMGSGERGYIAEAYRERLPRADVARSLVRISDLADVDLEVVAALIKEGAGAKPS